MAYQGKSAEWDQILAIADDWEATAKDALETLHFVHQGWGGYRVPPPVEFPRDTRRLVGWCRLVTPDIDVAPLEELAAELCHPEDPPRPQYKDYINGLWTRTTRILGWIRERGGIIVPADSNDIKGVAQSEAAIPQTPNEPSPWVVAAKLWTKKFTSKRRLANFRAKHPEMFRNPSPFKLEIHAALWDTYWDSQDKADFESSGDAALPADDLEIQNETVRAAAELVKSQSLERKRRGGK